MSETPKSPTTEQQSGQNEQQSAQQTMQLPLMQMIQFQRETTELFLSGLEISTEAQTRSVELTKDVLDSFIRILERAARDTQELTQVGFDRLQTRESMWEQQGQRAISQATQPLRQFATQTNPGYGTQQSTGRYSQQSLAQSGQQPVQSQGRMGTSFQQPGQQQYATQQQFGRQPQPSTGMQTGRTGQQSQFGRQTGVSSQQTQQYSGQQPTTGRNTSQQRSSQRSMTRQGTGSQQQASESSTFEPQQQSGSGIGTGQELQSEPQQ